MIKNEAKAMLNNYLSDPAAKADGNKTLLK